MNDFTEMCRVCMSKDKHFQNIFECCINNSFIHTVIMECAPVQISPDDNLPSLICNKCLNDLSTAHSFKKLCAETDTVLRECLNDNFKIKTEIFDNFTREIVLITEPSISTENSNTYEKSKNKIDFQKQLFVVITKLPIDVGWNQSPIKTYNCKHCSKIFTDKESLDRHLITHTDKAFYGCQKCPRVLKSKKSLTIHSRLHLAQRPFVCDICDKGFIRKHHLQKHAKTHFEAKPKTELAERLHVGNKSNMFDTEFLKFIESRKNIPEKNKDPVTHVDDVMFQCDLCYSSYKDKNDLWQHCLDVHKQMNDESNNKSGNDLVNKSDDCLWNDCILTDNDAFDCSDSDININGETQHDEQNSVTYSSSTVNKTAKFQCENQYGRKYQLKRHNLQKHGKQMNVVENTDIKVKFLDFDDLKNEPAGSEFLDDDFNKNYVKDISDNIIIDCIDTNELDEKIGCIDDSAVDEIVEEWLEDTVESLTTNDEPWELVTFQNNHMFQCKFCDRRYEYEENVKKHYLSVHKVTDKMQNQSDDKKENAISEDDRFYSVIDVDEATKYECNFCNRQFPNKDQAIAHYLNVHEIDESVTDNKFDYVTIKVDGVEKFQCKLCDSTLKKKHHLKRHYMNIHNYYLDKKVFGCEICPKVFASKESLQFHINKHTGATPFVCLHCNAYFGNRHDLSYHRKYKCEENNLESCQICGKVFRKNYLVDVHLKYHTGEKPYCCEYCGKTFYSNAHLHKHTKSHLSRSLFKCELCSKTFREKSTLKNHIWAHTGERPFMCEICGKSFRMRENFRNHRKTHTGEKNFICKFCSKPFATKSTMKNHIENIHVKIKEEERIECEICGKSFNSKRYLTLHNMCHADKNEQRDTSDLSKCNICGKDVKHLKIHLKYHNRANQYECSYCDQTYKRNSDLQRHISFHLGLKKYKCHFCPKAFALSRTLQNHLCIHTGERPYSCDTCGKQFIRKDHLRSHSRTHLKK